MAQTKAQRYSEKAAATRKCNAAKQSAQDAKTQPAAPARV